MTTLELYQSKHKIETEYVDTLIGPVQVCRTDGLRVFPVRSGWRHDPTDVRQAAEAESIRWQYRREDAEMGLA